MVFAQTIHSQEPCTTISSSVQRNHQITLLTTSPVQVARLSPHHKFLSIPFALGETNVEPATVGGANGLVSPEDLRRES